MSKKLTIEYVRKSFEEEGYVLLIEEYINSKQKLKYICPNGHRHSISWENWKQKHRCSYCAQKIKPSIGFVKKEFMKEGYVLLNDSYEYNGGRLNYICPNGHKHKTTWAVWSRGFRCPFCSGNIKHTIEFIRKKFSDEGYKLITKHYKNGKQHLKYVCPNGHKHRISWSAWNSGNRCPYCAGRPIITIEQVREAFELAGYKLISKDYVNSRSHLEYICSNGHKNKISFTGWKAGNRCPTCRYINNTGSGNPNWKGGISYDPYCQIWTDKEYKESIKERDGYKCLNPCCNSSTPDDLTIHHIDYNKKNCGPLNLITVCRSCNSKANKDRKWHKAWYQAIIKSRYLWRL